MYPIGPAAPAAGTGIAATGGLMGSSTIMAVGIALIVISISFSGLIRLRRNARKLK